MIIGNGLLGSSFKKHLKDLNTDVLFFTSGVSNSSELNEPEFIREVNLLSQYLNSSSYIVYFSTCSIYDTDLIDTPYVQHKLNIERILFNRGHSLIIRLPQIVGGGGNKNTLLNFLHKKIVSGEVFDVWANAKRSLIDVEDVVYFTKKLVSYYMPNTSLINLAAPRNISIIDLVKLIEKYSGFTAHYNLIDIGSDYSIDVSLLENLFNNYASIFHQAYFDSIVIKYCATRVRRIP